MPLIGDATAIHVGAAAVSAVYAGDAKVWPTTWTPASLAGLRIWFDASVLGLADGAPVNPWPNLGPAGPGLVVGSPPPKVSTNRLNGRGLVRFSLAEGRVRMVGTGVDKAHTLLYVARMVGPNVAGRVITAQYPPTNYLIGYWNGVEDAGYSSTGGFFTPNVQVPATTEWRLYGSDAWDPPDYYPRLFRDGEWISTGGAAGGAAADNDAFGGTFNISGYDATESHESCDFEMAEVLLYDRKLTEDERIQLEGYLRDKWLPPLDPDTAAYMAATGLPASYGPALDGLVVGLKAAELWSKMAAVYPMVGGTAALHRWNLLNPADTDAGYRLSFVGGAHSDALGYRPNPEGAVSNGGYADTHLVPLGTLAQDSTHLAYYSLADVPAISRCEMGCFNWVGTGYRFHIIARYQPTHFYYGLAEDGASNAVVPASTGLFVATRTAATTQLAYRNGVQVGISGAPSTPLPPVSVWVGGINTFVDRSDLPCGFASVGAALTAQNVADLYAVVQAFQVALGRAV